MLLRLLFVFLALLPVSASGQTLAGLLAGSWAMKVEGTVVFRFDLERTADGWSGTWARPRSYVTDGASFGNLSGPAGEQKSQAGKAIGEWVELTFADPRPGGVPDVFRFHLTGPDRAEVIYADTGFAPFVLEQVEPGTAPGPWVPDRVYRRAGVPAGTPVSYNAIATVAPRPALPAPSPSAPVQGPPAVIGR